MPAIIKFEARTVVAELTNKRGILKVTIEYPNIAALKSVAPKSRAKPLAGAVSIRYSLTYNCVVPLFPIVFYERFTIMRVLSTSSRKLYPPL